MMICFRSLHILLVLLLVLACMYIHTYSTSQKNCTITTKHKLLFTFYKLQITLMYKLVKRPYCYIPVYNVTCTCTIVLMYLLLRSFMCTRAEEATCMYVRGHVYQRTLYFVLRSHVYSTCVHVTS